MDPKHLGSLRTYAGLLLYAALCLGSMATMSIGVGVFLILAFTDEGGPLRFFADLKSVVRTPLGNAYLLAALGLTVACAISLAGAALHPLKFAGRGPTVEFLHDIAKTWYLFLPLFLAVGWMRLPIDRQRRVFQTWIVAFGVISALSVPQLFTGWPRAQPNPLLVPYFHTTLLLGHHLSVASVWIFPFFACLDLLFSREPREALRIHAAWLAIFLAAGSFTLFFAYSRTLWVALPATVGLWALFRLPRRSSAILISGILIAGAALSRLPIVQTRLSTSIGVGDRIQLWKTNWEFFLLRPFTGVGYGKNLELTGYYFHEKFPATAAQMFVGHAHNIFLEILSGTGLLGMLGWLAWWAVVLRGLWCARSSRYPIRFVSALGCALLALIINGVTQVNFWESKVLHQIMWMVGIILVWNLAPPQRGLRTNN